jgi:hypothetical protein
VIWRGFCHINAMKLKRHGDITYPANMRFRSWIVTGPPGSGKSHLINGIGGWPDEICIDVEQKRWWAVEPLTHRPREIHLAFPFKGIKGSRSVYDEKWKGLTRFPEVDFERIRIPKKKGFFLSIDWRARFVFDFILPPPDWIFEKRRERLSSSDVRLVDMGITPEWVKWQVHVHWSIARHFHQSGLQVLIRPFNTARPFSIPVLNKIHENKIEPSMGSVDISSNWSKLKNVRYWINKAAPPDWEKQVRPEHSTLPDTRYPRRSSGLLNLMADRRVVSRLSAWKNLISQTLGGKDVAEEMDRLGDLPADA